MKRSLALSLLAALSGSTYAEPASDSTRNPTKTATAQTLTQSQTVDETELSEKHRIMMEVRKQVGSELKDG